MSESTYAKVILDSQHQDNRLTTIEVNLHRFVLAELNTHRMFSRNSASSRAIPVEKQLAMIEANPAWPVELPAEHPGMQGGPLLTDYDKADAQLLIEDLFNYTYHTINQYLEDHPDKTTRLHKSVLNRYLEPFMWHKVIITSTDWDNFFNLRLPKDAQPELRVAAECIRDALMGSTPTELGIDEWHTPYIDKETIVDLDVRKKVSVARCARVSYLTHAGTRDIYKDIELELKLRSSGHWSPFEHVATPWPENKVNVIGYEVPYLGNFIGWMQDRHILGAKSGKEK